MLEGTTESKILVNDQSSGDQTSSILSVEEPVAYGSSSRDNDEDDYGANTSTPLGYYGTRQSSVPLTDHALMRIESRADATNQRLSRRITGADSLVAQSKISKEALPPIGGERQYPPPIENIEQYMVTFTGIDDPRHPHNWGRYRKIRTFACYTLSGLCATLGSAMFSAGATQVSEEFHVGAEVSALGTALFVAGFGSGPVIWGPLSEVYGRKIVLIVAYFIYVCLTFGAATGMNIQTVLLCRFFSGFTAIAPFVLGPSVVVDLYSIRGRSLANSLFSLSLFAGPAIAPIIAAFVVINPKLGWRWNSYITGICASFALILDVLLLEETHHGVLLAQMAEDIRRRTDNWAIYAAHEQVLLSVSEIASKTLARPIKMLITEPILLLITLYSSFIYGLLYAFLTIIPYSFGHTYGWHQGVRELPYVCLLIGITMGAVISYQFDKRYNRILEQTGTPIAEERLPPMMLGGVCFTVGLFWLCWTVSYRSVHWIVPCIGAVVTGIGFYLSYLPCITYLLDCYTVFSASAVSANAIMRSFAAAAFPLFMRQMLDTMTIKWAGTLLGCVAGVMTPISFTFYKYGAYIRRNSRYYVEEEI